MSDNVMRLENYLQTMSEAQKLEDIAIIKKEEAAVNIFEQLQNTAIILAQGSGCQLNIVNELPQTKICLDINIVQRVYENLIVNALRYAASTISVSSRYDDHKLIVTVADDGKGFTEDDLRQAANPYYKNPANTDDTHLGLGLYICRILTEKHGGKLLITNQEGGGAKVTAIFLVNCQ